MPGFQSNYIKILAKKFLSGTINQSEATELEKWYSQTPHPKPEWDLKEENKEELRNRIYSNLLREIAPVRRFPALWKRIAVSAVVIIVAGLSVYIFRTPVNEKQFTVKNSAGQIRKVMLPDHSLVWLKGNSSLDFPAHFSDTTRNVTLHGEALFEVSKDPHHPFIINAGNYITRVLGTSFNIKSDKLGAFKLTVLTGKVQVSSKKNVSMKDPVIITPGNEFELHKITESPHLSMSSINQKDAVVMGTQYPMDFTETGFDEIKFRIEEKFDVKISADVSGYQQCRVTANVTDQSLENTLKVICSAIGAKYTIQKDKIMIAGGGCN